jgi:hypothetical protein
MNGTYRQCPKCDHQPAVPMPADGECPACGVVFRKWLAAQAALEAGTPLPKPVSASRRLAADEPSPWQAHLAALLLPLPGTSPATFYGRCAALVLIAFWGLRLIMMDYRDGEIFSSFIHNIVLPIHEAGHVFFMPFGEFLTILGGSFFQVALPLGIGIAFVVKNRDNFGAAICLWWVGASLLDLAPYVYDALQPQLMLLGGHTGEDGPHDWIYLLDSIGQRNRAQGWGAFVHTLGAGVLLAGLAWGANVLWRQRQQLDIAALD